ncbi:MAG: DUF4136 domain-containing protein [Bryobacteraceae bacterium]
MRTLLNATILGALLCAAPVFAADVEVEFDESANFANYKTFRIGAGDIHAKGPALNNDLVKKQIENELRLRLTAKKLTETTGQADLTVRYSLGSAQKTDTTAIPAGRLGRQRRVVRTKYTEGTLIIDLLATRELVWRAIVSEDEKDPAKIASKIDDMVKKAIDKYPPKK